MIKDGTLGLPAPEPLGEGEPDLHYFMLGHDVFVLMPWIVKPYSQTQLKREETTETSRNVLENTFGILLSRFGIILATMEQRPRNVRDIVYTCVVLHNMKRNHQGRAGQAPNSGDDGVALQH